LKFLLTSAGIKNTSIHKALVDLLGRTVGIGGNDGLVQFAAMMNNLGLDIDQVTIVPYTFDTESLFSGQVDVIPAFTAGSLMGILELQPDVNLISPEDYGIHFYSDTLFTTDSLIDENPALVLGFLRAALRGHQDAIENPDEAVAISLKYAANPDEAVQREMMIASLPLINTGEDFIGWMKPEIWAGMEQTLREQDVLSAPLDIPNVYTMNFLEEIYK
jgi:ABC-type nitrate/sulfonate/bicarbonate transport system substrate-binding protein